jgi:SOS-response transcriptional repressor LexA
LLTGNLNGNLLNPGGLLEILSGIRHVPLLDVSDIPFFRFVMAEDKAMLAGRGIEPLPSHIKAGPRAYALKIADEAMSGGKPSLDRGDIAYFDPDADIETGCIVAAIIDGYPIIALRKYRVTVSTNAEPAFELIAANADYPSFSSSTHRVNLIGRLIGRWSAV